MSGICAIYRTGGGPATGEALDTMLLAGAHRGSDGAERRLEGPVGIGHLTQRSVDHRTAGLAGTADFSLSLSADARLDAGSDVERELKARDLLPRSTTPTDADVILAAYRLWGEDCVERLSGDFAFVLWDGERRLMFAARDRLGIKPLTYAERSGTWYFASEAQQIVALPEVAHRLDRTTLSRWLAQCLPADDRTAFEGVRKLEPGHWMIVSHRGGGRRRRYWSPGARTFDAPSVEELLVVLRRAVDQRLRRPSGPVGILMSGGLDSTAVAAIAHETLGRDLRPVTHAFETLAACDERQYTEAIRDKLGLAIEYHWPENRSLFPLLDQHPDPEEPFLGWTSIHSPAFESLQGGGAHVVLTGHGGDSVFGGSPLVYSDALRERRFRRLVDDLRRHARERSVPMSSLVYHYLLAPRLPAGLRRRVRDAFGRPPLSTIPEWIPQDVVSETGLAEIFGRYHDVRSWGRTAREATITEIATLGPVERAVGLLDRQAHRYGLDARHPFLDAELVDYAIALPPETFYSAGEEKLPLRRRLTQLPPAVRMRRAKTSFGAYFEARLRGADAAPLRELLDPPEALVAAGLAEGPALSAAVRAFIDGSDRVPASVIFFTANTESWLRSFPPTG